MAILTGNKQSGDEKENAKNTVLFRLNPIHVLVTGSNGQLGSELKCAAQLHVSGLDFIFTDVSELNITDLESVNRFVADNNVKYIVNCAAYTAVDKAEDEQDICYKINRDAVRNLGIAANKNGAKVIHISTDYVFDGTALRPYAESDPISPKSVYGKSKQEGEALLQEVCPQSIIIRTAWLYSVYGNNFVKTMIKLGKERDSLNVVADQTGTPTNAADLAKAIIEIIDYSELKDQFEAGVYHYSNEGVTTWYDFTLAIHKNAGITTCKVSPITTDQYPTKASRPQYSVLDKSKIKSIFKISIPEWEDSLKDCIKQMI